MVVILSEAKNILIIITIQMLHFVQHDVFQIGSKAE